MASRHSETAKKHTARNGTTVAVLAVAMGRSTKTGLALFAGSLLLAGGLLARSSSCEVAASGAAQEPLDGGFLEPHGDAWTLPLDAVGPPTPPVPESPR